MRYEVIKTEMTAAGKLTIRIESDEPINPNDWPILFGSETIADVLAGVANYCSQDGMRG